jgi:hypothetical protein
MPQTVQPQVVQQQQQQQSGGLWDFFRSLLSLGGLIQPWLNMTGILGQQGQQQGGPTVIPGQNVKPSSPPMSAPSGPPSLIPSMPPQQSGPIIQPQATSQEDMLKLLQTLMSVVGKRSS